MAGEFVSLLSCTVAMVVSSEEADLLCTRYGSWVRSRVVVLPNLVWADALPKDAAQAAAKALGQRVTFAYVGSVGVWQNFDVMLALYAAIDAALRQRGRQSTLRVVVPASHRGLAERIVQQHGLPERPELLSCQPAGIAAALVGVDLGFLLRDDSIVNQVASPLKLRDYLRAGVRVVASGKIGVLRDVPELESSGLVLRVSWADLESNLALVAERLCTEILRRCAEPFPWEVLTESFTCEAWMSATGVGDALRRRLAAD